jgi:hypothetical protein
MNIETLIDKLKPLDQDLLISFQCANENDILSINGLYPGNLISYRGYYERLAIEPTENPTTVGVFKKTLEDVIGRKLTGYKGGEFTMDKDTLVHIDYYGRSNNIVPINIYKSKDDSYRLVVFEIPGGY